MRCLSTLRASLAIALFVSLLACGGARPAPSQGSTPVTTPDAGSDADAGSSSEPPFASSAGEATTMIAAVVDSKEPEIRACVREFRTRKNLQHERVAVAFGVDQDGKLLGVTSKGKEDAELKACVQKALVGAPFPRSRAGVITVTKSYEERLQ